MSQFLLIPILCIAVSGIVRADTASSDTTPTAALCAGFPRTALITSKGLCSGLVATHLGFARGVAVTGDDIWITDMGGWRQGHGRLLRIRQLGHGKIEEMLNHLDRPNALLTLPNGKVLLGSAGHVDQFDPNEAKPGQVELTPVVTGLPDSGRHPVPALAAMADGTLFVNIGTRSDHCEGANNSQPDPHQVCPESIETPPRAAIISARWDYPPPSGLPASSATVVARGLRNSMAIDKSSHLWAAVNARDFINNADPSLPDETLPPDTLVRVAKGANYGWPQCYGMRQTIPEYRGYSCASKTAPDLLLPAHAAPLSMLYLTDAHPLGFLKNGLLISYHGYRKTGHRIVWIQFTQNQQISSKPVEIVSGWKMRNTAKSQVNGRSFANVTPDSQGSPVSMAQLANGSVMVTDDHNGVLVVIAPE